MNTSPHANRRSPHVSHDSPKHNLPLNPGNKVSPSSRPASSSKPAPRHLPEHTYNHPQPALPTHPPSTTYAIAPGPTKPTLPTPWQQVEELSLIQRELTAELLATQGKNKGLVAENASLRERVTQFERVEAQGQGKPSARLLQLEAENHRLSGDLARIVRGSYERETNSFDSVHKEVLALKKEQQRIDKQINDSTEKQASFQILLQRMAQNEQDDRVALEEIVALTEQYTEHLRSKTKEADETIRSLQPEVSGLQARMTQSTGLINDTRLQITEIGETCAGQNQAYAALRRTVATLQDDLQERMGEMGELSNEVTVLISANEGQTREIESLRVALQQATGERDEAQSELERLRMKVTSLEDEHHFLQSDFSAKSADMLDKFSAQIRDLGAEANEYREALRQLRVENAALEAGLQEHASAPRIEQDQETLAELVRQTKLTESHLQAVRDAERTNAILEEQLRHKDAEIALLQQGGLRVVKRDKREPREDEGTESGSSDESEFNSKSNKEVRKCVACGRYKVKVTQATQELNAAKLECGNLQQKLDKVKNLIQIYRQEKRQMEEYIEKEKRTAKSMIADVESLREVIEEKQTLIAQLRDEVTHLRNEVLRAQQTHAQHLSHAQDLARIQVQLKEDEVKAKLDIQANMQKEIQRLQAKLQRRKEELRASQRAKKDADHTLEAQYDRLQLLDRNYVHSRHHHANYTNTTLSYLHSLESRLADMRNDVMRAKQTQASCETEVIEPLRNALRAVWALAQDAQRQFDAETHVQEEELAKLKGIVAALPHQLQQPQLQQIQQQVQLQQQLQQQQQQHQDQQQQQQQIVEQHEQLVIDQIRQIDELKHQIRLLQLQLLEEKQRQPTPRSTQEHSHSSPHADVSQLYSQLDNTQEFAEQLRIVSDESLYATEKLELLDSAQQRAERELATQRHVFEDMRAANDAFMRSLEEQLWTLTQATPRYLETLEEPGYKLKPEDPDLEMHKFVTGLSCDDDSLPDIEVNIPTPIARLQLDKLREFSEVQPNVENARSGDSGSRSLSARFGSVDEKEGEEAGGQKGVEEDTKTEDTNTGKSETDDVADNNQNGSNESSNTNYNNYNSNITNYKDDIIKNNSDINNNNNNNNNNANRESSNNENDTTDETSNDANDTNNSSAINSDRDINSNSAINSDSDINGNTTKDNTNNTDENSMDTNSNIENEKIDETDRTDDLQSYHSASEGEGEGSKEEEEEEDEEKAEETEEEEKEEEDDKRSGKEHTSAVSGFNNFLNNIINDDDVDEESEGESDGG